MKKLFKFLYRDMYCEIICLLFLVLSLTLEPISVMFNGYLKILTSPSILLTDYVYVGGISATLFNVFTILLLNIFIIRMLKQKISGPIFCGLYMIAGFAFFGKNVLNTLPIYLGIFLYSRFKHVPYRTLILSVLFSTGISPVVSYTIFGLGLPWFVGVPLGLVVGIIVGFIIPAVAVHTITFHEGYNLYNTGFALGVISVFVYALYTTIGFDVKTVALYDDTNNIALLCILIGISLFSIINAFIINPKVLRRYKRLIKTTGRMMSDYVRDFGKESVLFNFGLLGLVSTLLLVIFNIPINGILFGTILATIGTTSYGLHIKNVYPVWIGCALAIALKKILGGTVALDMNLDIGLVIAFFFASCLAPIAGKYGIIWGIVAGFMHICINPLSLTFQGGFDLYNNGFTAGFVAAILSVVCESIYAKERRVIRAKK